MSGEDHLDLFKTAAAQWLCDPYSIEIRYIASRDENSYKLISCSISFSPLANFPGNSLRVMTDQIIAGRELLTNYPINKINSFLNELEIGRIVLNDITLELESKQGLSYFSEMVANDRWFCDAHLIIRGDNFQPASGVQIAKLNHLLRLNDPPFDGLEDLLNTLNLQNNLMNHQNSQIEIRILPSVDIISGSLLKGKFKLVLHAHPNFDTTVISLAIREFPESPSTRKQIASDIKWSARKDGLKIGILQKTSRDSFAILAMLMAGTNTIRRQFFEDAQKVPNKRLPIISRFDAELRMLKKALNGDLDSDHFEKAVNSLAYLMGFSGIVLNETDAPDIILSSPNENLVLIECTTRIKDFSRKLGLLVDRKNGLINWLKEIGDRRKVYSYLVCSLPQNQIAYDAKELAKHKVVLLTKESLDNCINQLRFPRNLEQLLIDDEKYLESILTQSSLQTNLFNQ